jgi:hypothetical protein
MMFAMNGNVQNVISVFTVIGKDMLADKCESLLCTDCGAVLARRALRLKLSAIDKLKKAHKCGAIRKRKKGIGDKLRP